MERRMATIKWKEERTYTNQWREIDEQNQLLSMEETPQQTKAEPNATHTNQSPTNPLRPSQESSPVKPKLLENIRYLEIKIARAQQDKTSHLEEL